MPELRDTTYTQFGTQIISSDPMREYLWAEQSYNKNARLKNTFKIPLKLQACLEI
ncbi:MAG: hypothetical protein CM15mP106_7570 [Candidatus Neomarinimicrobiota bacterium]|nr:MAG: hypothetical protein CM15mP106_7570 [Candidatus Neomarinimicrobiota bacterium]